MRIDVPATGHERVYCSPAVTCRHPHSLPGLHVYSPVKLLSTQAFAKHGGIWFFGQQSLSAAFPKEPDSEEEETVSRGIMSEILSPGTKVRVGLLAQNKPSIY